MLKVCCVTFDRTINYGSCLQAYALKTAVDSIKINGDLCSYELLALGIVRDRERHGKLSSKYAFYIVWPFFSGFYRRNMKYVNISTMADIDKLNDQFDAFVCGSDVIWNPSFTYGSDVYFLKFANKYAFSYAASFGRLKMNQEYLSSLQEKLSNLRQISVRESSAAEIIEENTNYHAKVVVDPVLLLSAEQWNQIASNKANGREYIFVYATHITDTIRQVCDQLQKLTGLRIIRSSTNLKYCLKYKTTLCTPERWIGLIRDARYIITNSFHATVFSTIYRKDFFTVVSEEKEGIYVRMHDFLIQFGLENRMISSPDAISDENVNYSRYDEGIDRLIRDSHAYLRGNLEKAQSEKQNRG